MVVSFIKEEYEEFGKGKQARQEKREERKEKREEKKEGRQERKEERKENRTERNTLRTDKKALKVEGLRQDVVAKEIANKTAETVLSTEQMPIETIQPPTKLESPPAPPNKGVLQNVTADMPTSVKNVPTQSAPEDTPADMAEQPEKKDNTKWYWIGGGSLVGIILLILALIIFSKD